MTIRFDDQQRALALSVRDLVHEGMPRGHLTLEVVRSNLARMAAGRSVHDEYQNLREQEDPSFRSEVRLKHQMVVLHWTVTIVGRVDGLTEEAGRAVVEEVKSSALDVNRLSVTKAHDWRTHTEQLEIYLWMLAEAQYAEPVGRLILVSLADASRHVLGVGLERERVGVMIRERLRELIVTRERWLAWLSRRREYSIPLPFEEWRPGQEEVATTVKSSLDKGGRLFVEAPTGMGKTAAVVHGALEHAFRCDRQVFWSTSRNTQQAVIEQTLSRFVDAGLPLRFVRLTAKEKVCLNEVVACRPEACPYARSYYDKLREHDLVELMLGRQCLNRAAIENAARTHEVCPFELGLDLAEHVDVVIGDYNYAFDPAVLLRRLFGDNKGARWIVVADEAHHLVGRARQWGSPKISVEQAKGAISLLEQKGRGRYGTFVQIAREVQQRVVEAALTAVGPSRNGMSVAEPSTITWRELADRIDEVGLDYALLKADFPAVALGENDPWLELARRVLRFSEALQAAEEETVSLVKLASGREELGLLCLDPSRMMGPHLQRLGGFLAMSATLSPHRFYRELLGLPPNTQTCSVTSPFPVENLKVMVYPDISTIYRDRASHAEATAGIIARCVRAQTGNAAVYFPSFQMLKDIVRRLDLPERVVLVQEPSMSEASRVRMLDRLSSKGESVVLAAVLGGIFAEGIDLPAGALSLVLVAGPALPPVGLEQDLLRAWYQERYGEGFLFASLVPGMTRVVQAAGRIIRRDEDRGVVVLLGQRFRRNEYRALLPWSVRVDSNPEAVIGSFWEQP
ncbi:MAG: hypothetical protein HN348_02185 [Proteobacteria bacterium]|nr:hypothetical protein [Pseudomonadota bacterium]